MSTFYLDMDGTIANLYAVDGWLPKLRAFDPTPYAEAVPLVNMARLARYPHKAQRLGHKVGIISWLSKESNAEYDRAVVAAKMEWLSIHLPSVQFDEIKIVAYGTPKSETVADALTSVLFDDEERNRVEWKGRAFMPNEIFEVFKAL